ncbi:ABC transporter permease [Desulfovibrio sulfodismutans]|uniref:ABC transporter permease n=1 Tax=Desulfolutivibrio sulfodismutans TaxID=63561 RepID=A0A7K3NP31_9BACT|nr:ABC transporter permease [Desulfolutivibrio sulfodismutans]NDY57952.1 ABC transporter permease [Desulfolutivibrio sulfodismutans]
MSFRIQKRIISALLRREFIALTNKSLFGLMVLVLEPLIFVGAMSIVILARVSSLPDVPVMAFVISGYIIMWGVRFHIQRAIGILNTNISFLYHKNVKILDIFIARGLMQCMATTFCFILLVVLIAVGAIKFPDNAALVIYSWFFVQWYGLSMSILTGSISGYHPLGMRICLIIAVCHVFMTGAFFMVSWVPAPYRDIVMVFPMVHATEMMRDGLFGNTATTYYSINYLISSNIVCSYIALAACRRLVQHGPQL